PHYPNDNSAGAKRGGPTGPERPTTNAAAVTWDCWKKTAAETWRAGDGHPVRAAAATWRTGAAVTSGPRKAHAATRGASHGYKTWTAATTRPAACGTAVARNHEEAPADAWGARHWCPAKPTVAIRPTNSRKTRSNARRAGPWHADQPNETRSSADPTA